MKELDHAWATIPRDPSPTAHRVRAQDPRSCARHGGTRKRLDPVTVVGVLSLAATILVLAFVLTVWFDIIQPGR